MALKTLPPTVGLLIEALDEAFPERCIAPDESLRNADRYAGKRDLINYLRELQRVTEKRALKDSLNV